MILLALFSLYPGAKWRWVGTDYNDIEWFDEEIEKPTLEELEAEAQRLLIEKTNNQYKNKRAIEYPPLTDLADAMYWSSKGDNTKLNAYYAKCEEVKAKYPKVE